MFPHYVARASTWCLILVFIVLVDLLGGSRISRAIVGDKHEDWYATPLSILFLTSLLYRFTLLWTSICATVASLCLMCLDGHQDPSDYRRDCRLIHTLQLGTSFHLACTVLCLMCADVSKPTTMSDLFFLLGRACALNALMWVTWILLTIRVPPNIITMHTPTSSVRASECGHSDDPPATSAAVTGVVATSGESVNERQNWCC